MHHVQTLRIGLEYISMVSHKKSYHFYVAMEGSKVQRSEGIITISVTINPLINMVLLFAFAHQGYLFYDCLTTT